VALSRPERAPCRSSSFHVRVTPGPCVAEARAVEALYEIGITVERMRPAVEYRILGPLDVRVDGAEVQVGGGRQRALLACLLLHAREVVSRDRLVDALWAEDPPGSADKVVQNHVSALRKLLPPGALATRGTGYELRPAEGELDLDRFAALRAEGRRLLAADSPREAAATLRAALAHWCGDALADCVLGEGLREEARALDELRLSALEERLDADLACGRHADAVAELESLVALNPYRQRFTEQLMLALYRCGRAPDALGVYRGARRRLRDDLGLDPGAALRGLERAILTQDAALDLPAARVEAEPVPHARQRSSRALVLAVCAAVALATVALLVGLNRGSRRAAAAVPGNSLAAIDPHSGNVILSRPVGVQPAGIVVAADSLWVASLADETVLRVDPTTGATRATIHVPGGAAAIAAAAGAVWVASSPWPRASVSLRRIDPRFDQLGPPRQIPALAGGTVTLAAHGDTIWVASSLGELWRVDARTGRVGEVSDPATGPTSVAADRAHVWLADRFADELTRVDARGVATPTTTGRSPSAVASGLGAAWVAQALDGTVARVDPATGAVTGTFRVGRAPVAIAAAAGSVWVADSGDGTIARIDPASGHVRLTAVGGAPAGLAFAGGRLWISVQPGAPTAPRASRRTLRIESAQDPGTIDPGMAYTSVAWQIEYATCTKLFDYPDPIASPVARVEPEAASALPRDTATRTVYSFRIRPGLRFSPPSNEPVTAEAFRYTLERSLSPRMRSPASAFLQDVVGAGAFESGKARHISGLTVHGDVLRVELRRPSPTLTTRLAMPFFCVVPRGTPIDPNLARPIPSAGPYYVASQLPGRSVVLRRNPGYAGDRPHWLAEIDIALDVSPAQAALDVEAGRADALLLESIPPAVTARLRRLYPAAHARQPRVIGNAGGLEIDSIVMNTSRAPMSDVRLRRAVNEAIDRRSLAAVGGFAGTQLPPADAYLPPGIPGSGGKAVYPLTPDVARARRLLGDRHVRAVLYTCDSARCKDDAAIVRTDLARVGIDVGVRSFATLSLYRRLARRGEPFDLGIVSWSADYADPEDILNVTLDGRSLGTTVNLDFAAFRNPAYMRRLAVADGLAPPRRYEVYRTLARDLERDAAPWAVYANETLNDFVSARVGCTAYQPFYGLDLAALCLARRPSIAP
jgi:DNA-binding SARP family transcriptional activator/ABC-type transport system substrate-binding protein/DNA-binding beta-propeller fold protein YncE